MKLVLNLKMNSKTRILPEGGTLLLSQLASNLYYARICLNFFIREI